MTRAIATLLIAASAVVAAALAPGCDRVVNLTPFYDAQPDLDALRSDAELALDAGRGDSGSGDGPIAPDDADGFPGDGASPGDGNTAPDDATRAR
jgi:hypothetical protein